MNGFFCAGFLNFFYFISLDYITVGDATAVSYFSGFAFSLVLESILLKAAPHLSTILSSLIGLAGLICISQAENRQNDSVIWEQIVGVLLATGSGFAGSFFYVNMQKWPEVDACLLVCASFTGCCVLPLPSLLKEGFNLSSQSIPNRFLALLGYACYATVGFLAIPGSKLAMPSLAYVIRMISISLCYFLQTFWLHKEPQLLSSIGSALIGFSIVAQSAIALLRVPKKLSAQKDDETIDSYSDS